MSISSMSYEGARVRQLLIQFPVIPLNAKFTKIYIFAQNTFIFLSETTYMDLHIYLRT